MTVPKQVDFAVGTVVSDTFLDRLQEISAAGAWNCVLRITGTSVQVVAATGQDASAVVIQGHMRYVESTQTTSFTGSDAAGAYGLWAVTSSDDNDPAWSLVKVSGTASPSGYAYVRKLGTVSWSGTALSALDQIAGFSKHSHLHQVGAGDELPSNAVGTAQLVSSSVTTAKIADSNVTTAKIADSGVTTAKVADSGVTTAKIADSNVTTAKIADSNVTTDKIADSNVTSAKIAAGAVGSTQIASGAVTTVKLSDSNVTTAKIADSGVTTDKIADSAVTAGKIASSTITASQIASSVIDRLVPTGSVMPYGGTSAPSGWLLCDGTEYPRASYSALDSVIGTTYSGGAYTNGLGAAGTTHFRVPDFKGRVPVGAGAGTGLTTRARGAASGQEDAPAHQHDLASHTHGMGNHTHSMQNHTHAQGGHSHGFGISATTTTENATQGFNNGTGAARTAPFPGHTHNLFYSGSTDTGNGGTTGGPNHTNTGVPSSNTSDGPSTNLSGSAGGHTLMQPYLVVNYIIKT